MTSFFRPLVLAGGVLLAFTVSLAVAQTPGAGRRGMMMYDVKSETTITGSVVSVEEITAPNAPGRRGMGGTHLVVKTETESIQVHLGPTAYLAEQKIVIAKGDTVEIQGSRVTVGEATVLLARQIKKGDATFTLRDASGRPLWSGGQR